MALFDTKSTEILDDTVVLSAIIETAENIQGFTEYVIKVTRGFNVQKYPSWSVRRRYRDFVALNSNLIENASHLDLTLPPKKIFGNLNREFVTKRTQELQVYLNEILSFPYLALSKHVKAFLDPKNYSRNFADLALQNVSMCMRGAQAIVVQKTLPNMGWRIRKTYFLVKSVERPKDDRHLVAWASYGPDFCMDYADAQLVLDFLCKIKHSQVRTPQVVFCTERGTVIVKGPLTPNGTLRDVLCNAKPEQSFIQKYACPKEPNCFDGRQLQLLGRKILEALKFLKDKSIPSAHLHCGNLAVTDDERVQILDIENDVLGLPPLYRPFMVQCKAVKTFDDVVVYCFGHTLYEISVGTPLNQPYLTHDPVPNDCPRPFVSVLQELLSQEATQNGLPTLDELLAKDVFLPTWYQTISTRDDVDFKVPSKVKQLFTKCKEAFMERLHQDQAEYRRSVKMKKAEDYMNSEEQKRLRKRAVRVASKEATLLSESAPSAKTESIHASRTAIPKLDTPSSSVSAPQKPISVPPVPEAIKNVIGKPVVQQQKSTTVSEVSSASSDQGDGGDGNRSALLESIRSFKAGQLKKAVTVDKSVPRV